MAHEKSDEVKETSVENQDDSPAGEPPESWATPLSNLVILPPRQKSEGTPKRGLELPVLRAEEPVQSLRAALSDIVGFAHITNYRFELVDPVEGIEAWGPSDQQVPSQYTGKNAVIAIPAAARSLNHEPERNELPSQQEGPRILSDYGTLTPLLDEGLQNGSCFQMVLERYDGAEIKDHLDRLKFLFDGNLPVLTSLLTPSIEEDENQKTEKKDSSLANPLSADGLPIDVNRLGEFFYMVNGEDKDTWFGLKSDPAVTVEKKKKKKKGTPSGSGESLHPGNKREIDLKQDISRMNELESKVVVPCRIKFSGFHPPPPSRRLMGDLAYFEAIMPGCETIHITAVPTGFYVNKSVTGDAEIFDPSPASKPCFSHELLDCLIAASPAIGTAWSSAISATKERYALELKFNSEKSATSLFFAAVRGDYPGFQSTALASEAISRGFDRKMITPSWLVPTVKGVNGHVSGQHNCFSTYSENRSDSEWTNTHGVDVRSGSMRDWNEEVQQARELPTGTILERIERARHMHKIMTEFGEASLRAVKAIAEGQLMAMNPMEPARCQVFLHNNIFISRAIDAGPETFKISRGDRAAKKTPNRESQCVSTFQRLETTDFCMSAHVLIDYLGTRYICQSVLPGILNGERSHTLLCGAVEAGLPLKWDSDFHRIVESKVSDSLMMATRPVPRQCFTSERLEEINRARSDVSPFVSAETNEKEDDDKLGHVVNTCMPIEAKAILGSDQRKYILDFFRMTPRDANWLPETEGGTGKWESVKSSNGAKNVTAIPSHLNDDEWSMCVLRPELVTQFTRFSMNNFIRQNRKKEPVAETDKEKVKLNAAGAETSTHEGGSSEEPSHKELDAPKGDEEKEKNSETSKLSDEEKEHLKSLKLNINVFIKDLRPVIDEDSAKMLKQDEQRVREASMYLWDDVLPAITMAVRKGSLPLDGATLTEFLHRHGVNCRYMGRLAVLAQEQESRDLQAEIDMKEGRLTVIERRTMPKVWLEMLEVEMLARASRHVLDSYLVENSGAAALQPAQTVASFLSALVSDREETAGQTENRISKQSPGQLDEEDVNNLSIFDASMDGECSPLPIRSRHEVWQDIELEIGRRFRYSLTLFNQNGKSERAHYLPLLRRICQRNGIRLAAKDYDLGGTSLCSGGNSTGGGLTASYPISPLDIIDIVPLMKHSASYNEGFMPCFVGSVLTVPPLQVSFSDARLCLEQAHLQFSAKAYAPALELAQESASLYQKIVDSPVHPSVIESIDLIAQILLEVGDLPHAYANAKKSLSFLVQLSGFDSPSLFNSHLMLFQIMSGMEDSGAALKHLKAAIYLMEVMAGPNHTELFNAYHRCGNIFSRKDLKGAYVASARRMFEEASKRDGCDRLVDGVNAKALAKSLAELGCFAEACEVEKTAYRAFSTFLGKDNQVSKESLADMQSYNKSATGNGKGATQSPVLEEQIAIAEAHAADLVAEEERKLHKQQQKKKKKNKK